MWITGSDGKVYCQGADGAPILLYDRGRNTSLTLDAHGDSLVLTHRSATGEVYHYLFCCEATRVSPQL